MTEEPGTIGHAATAPPLHFDQSPVSPSAFFRQRTVPTELPSSQNIHEPPRKCMSIYLSVWPREYMHGIGLVAQHADDFISGRALLVQRKRQIFYGHHARAAQMFHTTCEHVQFAWHALKTPFGVPSRWITSVGTLSPGPLDRSEQVYCGHSFAQHHPDKDGEIAFLHGGLLKTMDARVVQWQLENAGGIFQA